ncbi:Electron transfer flavoprotein subunit alpha [Vibrio harveyi]|uniref:electron transfer flavoprotein subunit alpha/FixB family protein n=1 Tax=Vibrio harveyi TaxID=669 RepID=UPI001EFC7613|nr:FAD-binding protein [Vibrio harveyi]MCG9234935.1 FAD-binding protein [Vibrio harveyi]MCG9589696.1 FAD-binding protein [Vibrio harveyi]CAH1233521.1 Electron transfer flavoprotein subunit alpha [Vibrio harveyi]CAH1571706.1 Electron transfer flavoprotein subunit alpha [Vibrio harveyi]CAH1585177.1 Electron transfer flavoprotein subunit alpha [Vibrio harveyi]
MENKPLATLVVVEHDNQSLSADTLRTLRAASQIKQNGASLPVTALLVGHQCSSVLNELKRVQGISQIITIDAAEYQHALAENLSTLIAEVGRDYSHILAPASTFGKNLMPRVAASLDVGQLSDVITIESLDTVVRPIYAGNALARVRSDDATKVMTIRSSAFDAIAMSDSPVVENVVTLETVIKAEHSEFVSQQKAESERPELPAANVVVSGGRGLGSKENFALVEQLADKLGGAIGASRAAVDAGFVSNDLQVGQTGKIVAPQLYIAVGISGAIQHLAGMKDSKVIVAINSDPEAPIFQVADYGLVGDLFEIMPELLEKV